jgi:elongation factor Ts
MANITASDVKELRERTGLGMMECKKALTETNGDLEKAEVELRKKGMLKADKKASRTASEGVIGSYIHNQDKIGVLIEVNCETDFVAKNESFRDLVKDVTLHIAASNPLYLSEEDVPKEVIEKEREIAGAQMKDKPEHVIEKIVEGKINKYYSEVCLLKQPFVKDPDVTIEQLVKNKIAEIGENIVIRRFTRYSVGEDL